VRQGDCVCCSLHFGTEASAQALKKRRQRQPHASQRRKEQPEGNIQAIVC